MKRKIGAGITSASLKENMVIFGVQMLYVGFFWTILKIV